MGWLVCCLFVFVPASQDVAPFQHFVAAVLLVREQNSGGHKASLYFGLCKHSAWLSLSKGCGQTKYLLFLRDGDYLVRKTAHAKSYGQHCSLPRAYHGCFAPDWGKDALGLGHQGGGSPPGTIHLIQCCLVLLHAESVLLNLEVKNRLRFGFFSVLFCVWVFFVVGYFVCLVLVVFVSECYQEAAWCHQ